MTLHVYFARKFLMTFLGILGGFFVFMWLIEFLEQIRRFDDEAVGLGTLAWMALLKLPESLYQIVTLVILLATILMLLTLARTSELVVTRATGRSAIQSLAAPVLTALALGAVTVGIANPMVASL